jgi:hypothetical protein
VSPRIPLVAALCLVVILTKGLGVHFHWSEGQEVLAGEHARAHGHAHADSIAHVAAELSAEHLESHLRHGDVDLDTGTVAAKIPLLKFYALFFVLIGALLWLIPLQPLLVFPPPKRPPRHRARLFLLLPPSQAPPCAA